MTNVNNHGALGGYYHLADDKTQTATAQKSTFSDALSSRVQIHCFHSPSLSVQMMGVGFNKMRGACLSARQFMDKAATSAMLTGNQGWRNFKNLGLSSTRDKAKIDEHQQAYKENKVRIKENSLFKQERLKEKKRINDAIAPERDAAGKLIKEKHNIYDENDKVTGQYSLLVNKQDHVKDAFSALDDEYETSHTNMQNFIDKLATDTGRQYVPNTRLGDIPISENTDRTKLRSDTGHTVATTYAYVPKGAQYVASIANGKFDRSNTGITKNLENFARSLAKHTIAHGAQAGLMVGAAATKITEKLAPKGSELEASAKLKTNTFWNKASLYQAAMGGNPKLNDKSATVNEKRSKFVTETLTGPNAPTTGTYKEVKPGTQYTRMESMKASYGLRTFNAYVERKSAEAEKSGKELELNGGVMFAADIYVGAKNMKQNARIGWNQTGRTLAKWANKTIFKGQPAAVPTSYGSNIEDARSKKMVNGAARAGLLRTMFANSKAKEAEVPVSKESLVDGNAVELPLDTDEKIGLDTTPRRESLALSEETIAVPEDSVSVSEEKAKPGSVKARTQEIEAAIAAQQKEPPRPLPPQRRGSTDSVTPSLAGTVSTLDEDEDTDEAMDDALLSSGVGPMTTLVAPGPVKPQEETMFIDPEFDTELLNTRIST